MIEVFKNLGNEVVQVESCEPGTWVNVVAPTSDEVNYLIDTLGVERDLLLAALDYEESPRIELEEDQSLLIIGCSYLLEEEDTLLYDTIPVGIIILKDTIITVSIHELKQIDIFKRANFMQIDFAKKTRFTLHLINRIAMQYLSDIRRIDRRLNQVEAALSEDMKNNHLLDLMALEKNLVYFTTAIKADENVVRKMVRTNIIKMYEEDEELLEDTLIEIMQANEMTSINLQIIRSIRDGFATIINNNASTAMKFLAGLTILFTFPTIVFSFYGMNTNLGVSTSSPIETTIMILVTTFVIDFIIYLFLRKFKML